MCSRESGHHSRPRDRERKGRSLPLAYAGKAELPPGLWPEIREPGDLPAQDKRPDGVFRCRNDARSYGPFRHQTRVP
jgi:hypothetical protein